MPNFQYIASNAKGENVRGTVDAADKADLSKKLKEKNLFLISFKADAAAAPSAPAKAAPAKAPKSEPFDLMKMFSSKKPIDLSQKPKGSVGLKELMVFTRQISISINAGMSFVDALQSIQQHAKNPLLAYTMKQVLEDVLQGKKMSEALRSHPDIFNVVYVNMVAAGESGGFVPEALNRVAEFLEKEAELRSKIKSAMVYPVVIGIVAFFVVLFMMMFIVPIFIQVFKDMNAQLPLPTRILIMVSNFFRHGGFLSPIFVVGLGIYLMKLRNRNETFRVYWDEKILQVPLFGNLITLTIVTRFIRTLATLVDNGVMALQAISMSRQVIENRSIEKVADEIYASVQQGNGISVVLYKSSYFPVLVANMVHTGEKTGELPTVLIKMSEYYEAEVGAAVRDLLTMMEPLMIVIMAIIVGFVIAGLMLPTFQMASLVG